jgi:hypothetical protein
MEIASPTPQPSISPDTVTGTVPAGHPTRWILGVAAFIVVLLGVWWFTVPSPASIPVIALASVTDAVVGQQFTVDIELDAGAYSVIAADVVVSYDPMMLKAVSFKPGALLPVELAGGSAENGRITMTVGGGTTPRTGNGSVMTVTFEALAPGQAVIVPVSGTRIAIAEQGGSVTGTFSAATITIQ